MISYFKLQKQQSFIRRFYSVDISSSLYNVVFLFHSTGSGKTCTAVQIAEQYSRYLRQHPDIDGWIYYISNKSSRENFINELTKSCGNIANNISFTGENPYLNDKEKKELEKYRDTLSIKEFKKFRKRILLSKLTENKYKFFNFQAFGRDNIYNKIGNNKFNDSLIIVDEAHNLLNENKFYISFDKIKEESVRFRMILMSATPMMNTPQNIINFINVMYKQDGKVTLNDIFVRSTGRTKNVENTINKKKLIEKFKGKISYLSEYDPINYPKRIDTGEIPDYLTYTKLIRVPMSTYQFEAYKYYYTGANDVSIKYISNFCLPNMIFNFSKYLPTEEEGKNLKNKNLIIKTKDNNITGPGLSINNIKKYSGKFYLLIKNILSRQGGVNIIYSKFVKNSGIKLIGEILRMNGYQEYGSLVRYKENLRHYKTNETYSEWKKTHDSQSEKESSNEGDSSFIPGKYVVFYDILSDIQREKILSIMRSPENKDGKLIRFLIGSKLIKESVDIKWVMDVDIMESQYNISEIMQIIGRAIRYKSHEGIDPYVRIHKYVSILPKPYERKETSETSETSVSDNKGKTSETSESSYIKEIYSAEEMDYINDEKNSIMIKEIERTLKIIAVDCEPNHDKYPKEIYNNTIECDYQLCDYLCNDKYKKTIFNLFGEKESNILENIFYAELDVPVIIDHIKEIFYNNVVYCAKDIIAYLSTIYNEYFVKLAFEKLVHNKDILYNKYGVKGYLQYHNNHFWFHPSDIKETKYLSINLRGNGYHFIPEIYSNITKILSSGGNTTHTKTDGISSTAIKDLIKSLSNIKESKFNIIISNLSREKKIELVEYAILEYLKTKLSSVIYNILRYFKYYLIDKNSMSTNGLLYNSNFDSYFDNYSSGSDHGNTLSKQKKYIYGHILDNIPKVFSAEEGKFIESFDILSKVFIPENDYIIGISTKDKKTGRLIFKLKYTNIKDSDKRKYKKGFKCNQINDKKVISDIYNTILKVGGFLSDNKVKAKVNKKKISDYCVEIEKLLREKQFKDPDHRWFYDYDF